MISPIDALKQLGYHQFIGEQANCIEHLVNGRDVIAMLPTGAGKSVIYQVTALVREGVGIVVSPLIALMQQQVAQLQEKGVRAEFLNSQLNGAEQNDLIWRLRHGDITLLYLSPEKLLQPSVMGLLEDLPISVLAVDEAHCVVSWGQQFRPEYALLGRLKQQHPEVPLVALSGSLGKKAVDGLVEVLHLGCPELVQTSVARSNIRLRVSGKRRAKFQLLSFLVREMSQNVGIVYCRGRKQCETLTDFLQDYGITAQPYHAGLSDTERERTHGAFEAGGVQVLIATVAYGMGMDLEHVDFVVHMDLPLSLEQYVQEVGRAGRREQPAHALLFYGLQDVMRAFSFIDEQGEDRATFTPMLQYLESTHCRQASLVQHFAPELVEVPPACGRCDRCLASQHGHDGTTSAQKLLSAIHATKGLVVFSTLIDMLLGKRSSKVVSYSLNSHRLFAQGRELTEPQWKSLVRKLLASGAIEVVQTHPLQLGLTEVARTILRSQTSLTLSVEYYYPDVTNDELTLWMQDSWQKVRRWSIEHNSSANLSDKQLSQIHHVRPKSYAALSRLTGLSMDVMQAYEMGALLELG